MRRVAVIGNSGSGKTWLGRRLADRLGVPYVELDGIFHLPGWAQLPEEEFRAAVRPLLDGPEWVVDGNYGAVRELIWARADTLVWLDLPRPVVTWQVVSRSVRRAVSQQELWNGNKERWSALLSLDPDRSVITWSVKQHAVYRRKYERVPADPAWAHLRFVRLRSRAAVRAFLDGAPATPAHAPGSFVRG